MCQAPGIGPVVLGLGWGDVPFKALSLEFHGLPHGCDFAVQRHSDRVEHPGRNPVPPEVFPTQAGRGLTGGYVGEQLSLDPAVQAPYAERAASPVSRQVPR